MTLWKVAAASSRQPTDGGNRLARGGKSLRSADRGGARRGSPRVHAFCGLPMSALLVTPLYALHREYGARFAPFAGYDMPIQYPDGILAEHAHTRAKAGLFDVSHMGQAYLDGPAHEAAAARIGAALRRRPHRPAARPPTLFAVAQRRGRRRRRSHGDAADRRGERIVPRPQRRPQARRRGADRRAYAGRRRLSRHRGSRAARFAGTGRRGGVAARDGLAGASPPCRS